MDKIDQLVEQVVSIDNSKSPSDIRKDLEHTKSVELTLNRIFDGEFLQGIEENNDINDVLIILDSDEEETSSNCLEINPPENSSPKSDSFLIPEASEEQLTRKRPLESAENGIKKKGQPVESSTLRGGERLLSPITFDSEKGADNNRLSSEILLDSSIQNDILIPNENQIEYESLSPDADKNEDSDMIYVPSHDEFLDDLLHLKAKSRHIDITSEDDPVRSNEENEVCNRSISVFERSFSETPFEALESPENSVVKKDQSKLTLKEEKKRQNEKKRLEREVLLEEKKRKKEEKQKEREKNILFEKENRLKNNRHEILKEMIVDIHPNFRSLKVGHLLESVLQAKMAEVSPLLKTEQHTVSWRRKCTAEWNTDSQTFIPLQKSKIINEPFLLVYMRVEELNEHIQNNTLYRYIEKLKRKKNDQIFLLIEGVESYYKKRALLQKRLFENQVRRTIDNQIPAGVESSKRKKQLLSVGDLPSQESIEEHLNELQFIYDIMLVPTKNDEDTVGWIESLTTDLALGRYKEKNLNNAYRGIKSGLDSTDTYFKMLQEIQLCTPAIAKSVMKEYPTLQLLHRKYQETESSRQNLLLSHLEVQRSTLQARDRTINKVMSKKICTIFNSDNPDLFLY